MAHLANNSFGNFIFRCRADKDDIAIAAVDQFVREISKTVRYPASGAAVGRSGLGEQEPLIPAESAAWTPPNAAPTFDTRKAVLQITQNVIEEAARGGNVVIVGRGGAYILGSHPDALHIFLRAAEAVRLKAIKARYEISSDDEAKGRLKQTDENWTAYIKQVYGHDRNHPAHYDMVLDTGRLGYEGTIEAVVAALASRKPIT